MTAGCKDGEQGRPLQTQPTKGRALLGCLGDPRAVSPGLALLTPDHAEAKEVGFPEAGRAAHLLQELASRGLHLRAGRGSGCSHSRVRPGCPPCYPTHTTQATPERGPVLRGHPKGTRCPWPHPLPSGLWPRRPGWRVRAPRPRRPTLRQPQRRTAPRPARRCPGAVPVPIPAPAAARLRTRSGAAPRLPEDRSGAAPRRVQSGSPSTSRCRTGASSPPKTLFRRGSPWSTSQTARPSPAYSPSFHLHASSTWSPLAASHPSTDQARPCVASEIRRRRACSGCRGRRRC